MGATRKCFEYAKRQFLGMQLVEFSFSTAGKDFYWPAQPKHVSHILKKLAQGKDKTAFEIFKEHLIITSEEETE